MTEVIDFSVFGAGEVVALHLAEAVVAEAGDGYLIVRTGHDELTLAVPQEGLRIIRVRPADGLPQPGEVWRDRFGQIWFARGRDGKVAFYGADAKTQHPGIISMDPVQVHREFGPIERIWTPPEPEPEQDADDVRRLAHAEGAAS